jgi:hypothetical protein
MFATVAEEPPAVPGEVERWVYMYSESSDSSFSAIEDEEKATGPLPAWLWTDLRRPHSCVPQLGEEVAYCKAGHIASADRCKCETIAPPYSVSPEMPAVAFAVVTRLAFFLDYLLLTLRFDDAWAAQVYFPVPDSPTFLVSADIYDRAMRYMDGLQVGAGVSAFFLEGGQYQVFHGVIARRTARWQEAPFECLTVKWDKSVEFTKMSPWELVLPEDDTVQRMPITDLLGNFRAVLRKVIAQPPFAKFVRIRRGEANLFKKALKPMDLTLLQKRVESEWYQTADELIEDVRRLAINAKAVGLPQEAADCLVLKLFAAIEEEMENLEISTLVPFNPTVVHPPVRGR